MINPGRPFNMYDGVEIFLRRMWFFLIPFALVLSGTLLYLWLAPKEYKATVLMLVTPPKVPERFVPSTVTSRMEEAIQSIGPEIISRGSLEKIIREFYLYSEESKTLKSEEIVEIMKKNLQVEPKTKGKEGYFTISYIGGDSKTTTLVTNRLASLLIEENLKSREQQAQGTSEFLMMEVNATREKLEEQEKKITRFKKQFMGELPEQRDANLRVLDQLEAQSQRIGDNLKAVQDRKLLLQKQLADFNLIAQAAAQDDSGEIPVFLSTGVPALVPRQPTIYEVQLDQMRNQLVDLQGKYTAKHPEITLLKKKIAELEKDVARIKAREAKEEKPAPPVGAAAQTLVAPRPKKPAPDVKLNPRYKEIENQILATDMELQRIRQEEGKIRAQVAEYRQRIDKTPSRELALSLLTRDYQNMNETYQSILQKAQAARQAENLERLQKGEQFKIIDPAREPEKPHKPNVPKTFLIGIVLAILSGLGGAFLREQMDRSFRDAEDLQSTFGVRVLANIPRLPAKAPDSI